MVNFNQVVQKSNCKLLDKLIVPRKNSQKNGFSCSPCIAGYAEFTPCRDLHHCCEKEPSV